MIAGSAAASHIPESIAQAHHRVQTLVEKGADLSLEELQGAVEYLLDRVKASRGINRRMTYDCPENDLIRSRERHKNT
jgi:hypothetical protein